MKSTLFSQNLVTYLNHEEVFYAMKNANTNAMLTKSWFKNDISMIYFPFHHVDDALKELFFFCLAIFVVFGVRNIKLLEIPFLELSLLKELKATNDSSNR